MAIEPNPIYLMKLTKRRRNEDTRTSLATVINRFFAQTASVLNYPTTRPRKPFWCPNGDRPYRRCRRQRYQLPVIRSRNTCGARRTRSSLISFHPFVKPSRAHLPPGHRHAYGIIVFRFRNGSDFPPFRVFARAGRVPPSTVFSVSVVQTVG